MSVTSLSEFIESDAVYIFFEFSVLCNDIKNVFRGEAVTSRAKKKKKTEQQWVGVKVVIKFMKKNKTSKALCLPNASEF